MIEQIKAIDKEMMDSVPTDLDQEIPLSDNALTVLRGSDGQPAE